MSESYYHVRTYKLYRGCYGVYSIQLSDNGDGCFDVNTLRNSCMI